MSWIDIAVAFDTDSLDQVQALFQQAPQSTDRAIRRDMVPYARHFVDKRLRVEPGAPRYPLRWTPSRHPEDRGRRPNTVWGYYSRQKAAFFATNGFGAGIPYHRQHRLIRGWHVVGDYRDGFGGIRVTHDSRISLFVVGKWQQGYHQETGWPQVASELQVLSIELNERLEQLVYWVGEEIAQGKAS